MKLQIMQLGGFMPPYTVYLPVMVNSGTARLRAGSYESSSSGSSSKSSSSSDKGDLTMKDIIAMAEKMDGLPSDMAHITLSLMLLSNIASIPGMADSSVLATYYFTTLAEIKNAKYYKERYDKAFEDINKKQALSEVAISPDGKLILADGEGQVQYVSVEDYKANPEDYADFTPVRNAEILQNRALARPMDSTYITALSNATSLPEIDKLISLYIGSLGSYETKTSTYEKRKAQTVLNGVSQLLLVSQDDDFVSEAGIDGLYNVSHLQKDNIQQILSALKYIYLQLPENAKTLLKYYSDGTDKGAIDIIMSRLTQLHSKTDHKDEILKFDVNGNKLGSASNKAGRGTLLSPVMTFLLGRGYQEKISLNPGSSNSIKINGRISALADANGKPIGTGHNLSEIGNSLYSTVLELDKATFGGHELNLTAGYQSVLKNTDIVLAELPLDLLALDRGIVRPDIGMCNRLEQAEDYMMKNNIDMSDFEKVNEVCQLFNLPPKYTKVLTNQGFEWQLNKILYQTFAMILSVVNGKMIKDTDKLSAEDLQDNLVERIEDSSLIQLYTQQMKDHAPGKKFQFDDSNFFWGFGFFDWTDAMYEGNVFIPVRTGAYVNASLLVPSAARLKAPLGDANNIYREQLLHLQNEQVNPEANYQAPPSLNSLQ